jgi:dihydroorotase
VCGTPNAAEDVMTARDIILAEMTGCRLHIAHVSTKGSASLIREAKKRGVKVTAETCPHYFTFIDEDVERIGVNAKMNPPLRSKEDRDAIIEAIVDGTIDCISTDHAPHSAEEKGRGLASAPNGIIGLQTSFAAAYTYLVKAGHITLERLSELLTYNPCRILGIAVPEEIIDIEIEEPFVFDESMILSKSHNSPYIGKTLYGKVIR